MNGDANVTGEMKDVFCDGDKGDEIEVEDFVENEDVTFCRKIASSSSAKRDNT